MAETSRERYKKDFSRLVFGTIDKNAADFNGPSPVSNAFVRASYRDADESDVASPDQLAARATLSWSHRRLDPSGHLAALPRAPTETSLKEARDDTKEMDAEDSKDSKPSAAAVCRTRGQSRGDHRRGR